MDRSKYGSRTIPFRKYSRIRVNNTVTLEIGVHHVSGYFQAWAIKMKIEIEPTNSSLAPQHTVQTITGRLKKNHVGTLPLITKVDAATQTL